jgi:hypothetical protein
VQQPRGAAGPTLAVHGYEIALEHVHDVRCDFFVATIRSDEPGALRMWGVVALTKEDVLAATTRRVKELLSLRERGAGSSAAESGSQVA